jgi:uncharacterized membrane protein
VNHLNDDEIQSRSIGSDTASDTRVERHLAECDQCQRSLRVYEELDRIIESSLGEETPAGFEAMVMDRLTAENRALRSADLRVTAAAAAVLVVIALAFFLSAGLRDTFSYYWRALWGYVGTVFGQSLPASELTVLVIFTIVVFVVFALVDRLALRNLSPETNSDAVSRAP